MKAGLSLSELAAELDRQNRAKRDFLVDTRELTLLSAPASSEGIQRSELHLPDGAGEFELRRTAARQMATHLKIPARYWDMLEHQHLGLLDHSVNTLLREAPARRMVRAHDFGEDERYARAFLSDRYRRLDNYELAEVILDVARGIPDVQVPTSQITEGYMYITLLAPRTEGEVRPGDQVQAGIRITNSEIGWGALRIQPLVYRLICSNGMVVAEASKTYHVGRQIDSEDAVRVLSDETIAKDDAAFFSKIRDVMRAAVNQTNFSLLIEQMQTAMSTVEIRRPIAAMEEMSRTFGFSDGEKESILTHLTKGGDLTAWGALNAVTRAAQDVESYDRSMELEAVGGHLLEMAPTRAWARIAEAEGVGSR